MRTNISFSTFAYIAIPGGIPEPLWYGVPDTFVGTIVRGSVVMVEVRKSLKIALVLSTDTTLKEFEVKPLEPHPSGYIFSSHYIDMIEWVASTTLSSINKTVQAFLPANLSKWLEKLDTATPPNHTLITDSFPDLTQEQIQAVHSLKNDIHTERFGCTLIHGVTGSGKSRVYMEVARAVIEQGKNVLILVPEISLTPQTFANFSAFFSVEIDLLHSNLGEKQKRMTWLRLLTNQCRVLMGTRSAALAPLNNIGLIIIDEEHDASFKQHDPAPRYHARDLAHYRAHQNNTHLILGSATPSLESYYLAQNNSYSLIEMNNRVHNKSLPSISVIDMKQQRKLQGDKILSIPLREKLVKTIERGEQAIILHNRRGYSTARICGSCGAGHTCLDCDIPLIYHKKTNTMLCHYCSRCYPVEQPCRACGSKEYIYSGTAIEKAEEELLKWLPSAKIIRMDRDTTSKKGSAEQILNDFRSGKYNILIGTQMVAKGHDFPNVEIVAILSADTGMNVPDFRTNERMFQLITQVAGRAGRHSGSGEVILQTYNPDDPLIKTAIKQDYKHFYTNEITERSDMHYPPVSKLISLEISGPKAFEVKQTAQSIAQFLQAGAPSIKAQILGPVEANVAVVKRQYRMRFLIKGKAFNQLRWLTETTLKASDTDQNRAITIKIDIDPQSTI